MPRQYATPPLGELRIEFERDAESAQRLFAAICFHQQLTHLHVQHRVARLQIDRTGKPVKSLREIVLVLQDQGEMGKRLMRPRVEREGLAKIGCRIIKAAGLQVLDALAVERRSSVPCRRVAPHRLPHRPAAKRVS